MLHNVSAGLSPTWSSMLLPCNSEPARSRTTATSWWRRRVSVVSQSLPPMSCRITRECCTSSTSVRPIRFRAHWNQAFTTCHSASCRVTIKRNPDMVPVVNEPVLIRQHKSVLRKRAPLRGPSMSKAKPDQKRRTATQPTPVISRISSITPGLFSVGTATAKTEVPFSSRSLNHKTWSKWFAKSGIHNKIQ